MSKPETIPKEGDGLSDCWNCGPTERAIFAKNLCVKCFKVDRIRLKFDPKSAFKKKFEWNAKRIATLRYFRVGLKQPLRVICAYLGCTLSEGRRACKRYKVDKNSRGPYTRKNFEPEGRSSDGG